MKSKSSSSLSDSCFTTNSMSNSTQNICENISIKARKERLIAAASGSTNSNSSITSVTVKPRQLPSLVVQRTANLSHDATHKHTDRNAATNNTNTNTNDEMASSTCMNSLDSLETNNATQQPSNKINSKLLNEILQAHVDEPPSLFSQHNKELDGQRRRSTSLDSSKSYEIAAQKYLEVTKLIIDGKEGLGNCIFIRMQSRICIRIS